VFHAKIERDAARPVADGALDSPAWWQTRAAALLLVLAAAIPLLYPAVPPLVDLPGHMARYRIELDLANSPDLQRYFTFHWRLIGNLGVDLLIIPLSKLLGLELATKLVVAAIPPLTVAGFLAVARQVHGRIPATALLALPLAYSQPFNWGFVNYTLSMALALLAFAGWLKLTREQRPRLRAAIFVPLCGLLYVVHVGGWFVFGTMAFASELIRFRNLGMRWIVAFASAVVQCLALSLPIGMMLVWRGDATQPIFQDWLGFGVKPLWLISLFRYNSQAFETGCAVLTLGALALVALRARRSFAPPLVFAATLLFGVFLLLPWRVLGSAHTDMRLAPYIIALGLLAGNLPASAKRGAREIALAAVAFFALFLAVRTVDLARVADEQQRQLAALAYLPRGVDVTTLARADCREPWKLTLNGHLGSYAIIRRNAFSNDQWLTPGINLLGLRDPVHGAFAEDPSQMVTPNHCPVVRYATRIDPAVAAATRSPSAYLWLIDIQPDDPRVLTGWRVIWRYEDSALYRRAA
jgi:hypothetical protein